MTTRKQLNETLKSYRRLKEQNPDLLNEDLNAILVAASNSAIAQAIYTLGSSVDDHEEPINVTGLFPEAPLGWLGGYIKGAPE